MFVNNINPVLLKIGFLEVRYYGIVYAIGFIIAYLFLKHYIKKGKIKDLEINKLDDLILYLVIGIVVGARAFYFIFYDPMTLFRNPIEFFFTWHGGMSFHGGLIGAVTSMAIFCRKNKVKWKGLFDAIVIPASLALALGRIANFTNQELYGPITNLPWCVRFSAVDEFCRHPYQIYASLSHLIMFFILIYVYSKQKKEGTAFYSFVFLYGAFRFMTDFFREEYRIFGISMGQFLCLIMIIVSGYIILKKGYLTQFLKKNKV